jgi:hypothetical protein
MKPENESPAIINDHPFQPPEGQWYERCVVCGLGAAAHAETTVPLGPQKPPEGDQ